MRTNGGGISDIIWDNTCEVSFCSNNCREISVAVNKTSLNYLCNEGAECKIGTPSSDCDPKVKVI